MPSEILQREAKPQSLVYLPHEGLQGEEIPSYILWKNVAIEQVQVAFHPPLRFKEIFNAESFEIDNNVVKINKVGIDGYVGLSFESSKVSALDAIVPIEYVLHTQHCGVIKEIKKIRLFRPELEVKAPASEISVNPDTGFVKGRIRVKNVGRGTMIMRISSAKGSPTEITTPPENREFVDKFNADLHDEMSSLTKEFPDFSPVWNELKSWDTKDFMGLSTEERTRFIDFVNRLAKTLASNKMLLRRFAEAYAKAFARNAELLEAIRKFIAVYESLVSKDLLLVNPFDEIHMSGKKTGILLKIVQTDKVLDTYEDIIMPEIELSSARETKVPIYRLFDWGEKHG
jgi:hypothetical protein